MSKIIAGLNHQSSCNHQFWKDQNPPECFNCGKTKDELYKEHIEQEVKERILKALPEEAPHGSVSEYYSGFNACLKEITDIITKS